MNRHEKFMANCAAQMESLQRLRVEIHGTEALPDPTWDDFLDAHPELTDAV